MLQKWPGKRSKNGLLPQQKWLCLMIWVRIYPFQELIHSKNWSILAPFDPFSEIINLWQFSFQIIFSEKHAPNSILKRGKYKGRDIFMYIINSTGIIETSAESRKKLALRTVLNNTTHYSLILIPSDSFPFLATCSSKQSRIYRNIGGRSLFSRKLAVNESLSCDWNCFLVGISNLKEFGSLHVFFSVHMRNLFLVGFSIRSSFSSKTNFATFLICSKHKFCHIFEPLWFDLSKTYFQWFTYSFHSHHWWVIN